MFMGAKTWMLVYADTSARDALKNVPQLDRDATAKFAHELFPDETLEPLEDGDLIWACPRNKEICIGCFPGVSIVAAKEFGIDYPSEVPRRFIEAGGDGTITFHAMHSVVDWFAYAQWQNGTLIRSLSLSPDDGVKEDIGEKVAFEEPYWSGQHPAVDPEDEEDDYSLPFHPLELGEAALVEFFGYQLEGFIDPNLLEPEDITLMRFKRKRPFWKFW
jgi:hypothetical protein